ncbi:HAD family hydrolase [Priestia koreensis]|uniref:HAD family hydrolase n=1 Tax=Priestia koreensis TaxID=284581 RepID=A0A0M0LHK7_9BACI|nr:HAD family hydrolase [Priestia koreensis]KOO50529.1 HAD family hydrolase [Priestia koreensis]
MIKLFVSDLDGTLLNHDKKVEQKEIDALQQLKESGVEICLASGRMDNEIVKVSESLEGDVHRVSQNGAFVLTHDDQSLHEKTFDHELASKLYSLTKMPDKITLVCSDNTNFVEEMSDVVKEIEKVMFFPIQENPTMREDFSTSLNPSKITVLGDHEQVLELQKKLNDMFGDDIDTYISAKSCLDIMPKHISKGNAIAVLLDHLDLQPDEIACVGDNFNDIPMFRLTPNSFAMSEAYDEVKQEANYVVDSVSEAVEIVLRQNREESKMNPNA